MALAVRPKPSRYLSAGISIDFLSFICDNCFWIFQQLNILIENFPDRYNPDSVLQIDMFHTSEEKLQDQLTKTMSVVFEGVVEMGGQSAENRRLTYAWRLKHMLKYNSFRQNIISDVLQALIILLSLASTAAACFYIYETTISTVEAKNYVDVLLKINLMLPLAVTVSRGIAATLNPQAKAIVLEMSSIRIETEIYMYRTKIGRYNVRKGSTVAPAAADKNKSKVKDGKGKGDSEDITKQEVINPRKVFSTAIDNVWKELASSDITKGALVDPPESQDPLDDINARLKGNKRKQDLLTRALRDPPRKPKTNNSRKMNFPWFQQIAPKITAENLKAYAPTTGMTHDIESNAGADKQSLNGDKETSDKTPREGNELDKGEPIETSKSDAGNDVSRQQDIELTNQIEEAVHAVPKQVVAEDLYDDGISTLTADEYMRVRVIPLLASFSSKTPGMSLATNTVTSIVIALSVLSSVFSTFNLTLFIPLLMAFSSAISVWMSYKQVDLRLMQTHGLTNALNQLIVWWDSLSMIEKRVPANKEYLVLTTEAVYQGQVATFTRKKDDDDDKKSKGTESEK